METVTVKTADGLCYRAADSGHESSEAIVCLHGFTGSKESWMFLRGMFPGERMVMIDCLGHGETDAPVQAARYTTSRQVADLAAVFDQLKLHKVKLIGYSMGETCVFLCTGISASGVSACFGKYNPGPEHASGTQEADSVRPEAC